MHVDALAASAALHVTAPVKLAVAPLVECTLLGVVAPATTEKIAAVDAGRGSVAGPAAGAYETLSNE
jgi:hypothetical protein